MAFRLLLALLLFLLWPFLLSPPPAGAVGDGATDAEPPSGMAMVSQPSPLETLYSRRADTMLRLFGRDLFDQPAGEAVPILGTVADSYRLGPGDELNLLLRGQISRSDRLRIGSDGMLTIADLHPIPAAGRSLGEVRQDVAQAVTGALMQTQSFLSLASARQVEVLVMGEVARPGHYRLGAFATVLDALARAGGVTPAGSLRAIRLVRADGSVHPIDLYPLLTDGGGDAGLTLDSGARLLVPPIGATVAAAGAVKRPGIYELPPDLSRGVGEDPLDNAALLRLAGGPLWPGADSSILLRFQTDGGERPLAVTADQRIALRDGDILLHAPDSAGRRDAIDLHGPLAGGGPRPLPPGSALADLLSPDRLPADLYRPFAVLLRRHGAGGAPEMRAIDLAALLRGRDSTPALDGDRLVLLTASDIAFLRSDAVLARLGRGPDEAPLPSPAPACAGVAALEAALSADPDGALAAGPLARAVTHFRGVPLPCPPLFQDEPDLLPFLLRHAALARRGALRPGPYPVVPGTPRAALAALAGAVEAVTGSVAPGQIVDFGGEGVDLAGTVRQPGRWPLADAPSLRRLLEAQAPWPAETYGLAAVLERGDGGSLARQTLVFAPVEVLAGRFDLTLRDGDRVILLDRAALTDLPAPVPLLTPATGPPSAADPAPAPVVTPTVTGPAAVDERPALLRAALTEQRVGVRGAVRKPGDYPVAGPVALGLLIQAAGGLTADADPDQVELVPAADTDAAPTWVEQGVESDRLVQPGEAIRVGALRRPAEPRQVLLAGEVMQPGTYDLVPGETLSGLLARAGGLTPHAYPAGAIFTRESARLAEEEGLRRAARELDRALTQMLASSNPPDPTRVALVRQLSGELRSATALGRITVALDPELLAQRPELDLMLLAGDRIFVPKRPLTVTVAGEVLAPASLLFDPEKEVEDYLREAGGLSRYADRGRIFLLHPDGSAEPLSGRWGRHGRPAVTPGATLVVPRDAEPLELLPLAQSLTTILSQIAFSAAAIASISR